MPAAQEQEQAINRASPKKKDEGMVGPNQKGYSEMTTQYKVKRKARYTQEASKAFDDLSEDGYYLKESKLEEFLAIVLELPSKELNKDAIQLIKDTTISEKAQISNTNLESSSNEIDNPNYYTRRTMLETIDKYNTYVEEKSKINQIFYKFNTSGSGQELNKSQLQKALQDHENRYAPTRYTKKGMAIKLIVESDDVDEILKQTDANNNNKISKAELLPAIQAWETIAKSKANETSKPTLTQSTECCIIL